MAQTTIAPSIYIPALLHVGDWFCQDFQFSSSLWLLHELYVIYLKRFQQYLNYQIWREKSPFHPVFPWGFQTCKGKACESQQQMGGLHGACRMPRFMYELPCSVRRRKDHYPSSQFLTGGGSRAANTGHGVQKGGVVGGGQRMALESPGQRPARHSSGYCEQEARDESRRLWTGKDLEEHQSAVLLPVYPTEHVRTDSLFELQLRFLSGRRQVKPIDFISGNKLLEAERVDKN